MRKAAMLWALRWALFGLPWTGFTSDAHVNHIIWNPLRGGDLMDDALNFLYYVPLATLGTAFDWNARTVLGGAAMLSVTIECAQIFSADRDPNTRDLALNLCGAVTGIALAYWLGRSRYPL